MVLLLRNISPQPSTQGRREVKGSGFAAQENFSSDFSQGGRESCFAAHDFFLRFQLREKGELFAAQEYFSSACSQERGKIGLLLRIFLFSFQEREEGHFCLAAQENFSSDFSQGRWENCFAAQEYVPPSLQPKGEGKWVCCSGIFSLSLWPREREICYAAQEYVPHPALSPGRRENCLLLKHIFPSLQPREGENGFAAQEYVHSSLEPREKRNWFAAQDFSPQFSAKGRREGFFCFAAQENFSSDFRQGRRGIALLRRNISFPPLSKGSQLEKIGESWRGLERVGES